MNLVDDELLLKVFKRVRITSICGFKSEMQGSKRIVLIAFVVESLLNDISSFWRSHCSFEGIKTTNLDIFKPEHTLLGTHCLRTLE
jgi:hypothetical protein